MFEIGCLPDPAARLWEAAAFATGRHHDVMVTVGPDEINISRMVIMEVIFSDDPPSRADAEAWVIGTAQGLGFDCTELTHNGTERSPDRLMIQIPLEGFTVTIQCFWSDPKEFTGDPPRQGPRRASSGRSHLELVSAGHEAGSPGDQAGEL